MMTDAMDYPPLDCGKASDIPQIVKRMIFHVNEVVSHSYYWNDKDSTNDCQNKGLEVSHREKG